MNDNSNTEEPSQEPLQEPNEEPAKEVAKIGRIEWCDLTVQDASRVKDFYCAVVGWKNSEVPMGSYADYNINNPGSGETIAGICHQRDSNRNIPPQWLMYVRVASVVESSETCKRFGGEILDGPRRMGGDHFCVIRDPEGAVLALISDR